jgi:hypothetical protein
MTEKNSNTKEEMEKYVVDFNSLIKYLDLCYESKKKKNLLD